MNLKNIVLAVLGGALGACQPQVRVPAELALKHQSDPAYQRQAKLLQADEITLSVKTVGQHSPALRVLTLAVLNPRDEPTQPDTLRQRVRKLARLVVADLAHPDLYQVVNAQVTFKAGWFSSGRHENASQSFIYPMASLR